MKYKTFIGLLGLCMIILIAGCGKTYYIYDECVSGCKEDVVESTLQEEDVKLPLLTECNETAILQIGDDYVMCYRCDYVNWSWICPR